MGRIIRILLAISRLIFGVFIFVIAYTTPLNPYWLNTILGVIGFALMAGGVTYVFIKGINKPVN